MDKILMIARLIPAIIEVISAIEAAIPEKGKGAEKLEAVRGILEASVEGFNQLWPSLEKVIKVLVDTFNAVGVFKK